MAQVIVVEPFVNAPFVEEDQGPQGGESHSEQVDPATRIPGFVVDIGIQRSHHHHKAIGGMHLHEKEIEGEESEGHEGEQLENIQYGERPSQFAGDELASLFDACPLEQCDGEHTGHPAR